MSCYSYSAIEITKLFCIKCRFSLIEPFYDFYEFLVNPALLPKNSKIHEIFRINLSKNLAKIEKNSLFLAILCSKICAENSENANFLYEWPSENITISFNDCFLKYSMNSYLILENFSKNSISANFPQISAQSIIEFDYKENFRENCVFAVVLLRKKDFRVVAKEIAQMNQLSHEEALKKFEFLRRNDEFSVFNEFPIKDPITMKAIYLPARGVNCLHLSCFDLMNFLKFNESGSKFRWKCPICKKLLMICDICIDSHLHRIIKGLRGEFNEDEMENVEFICFDEKGEWKAKKNFLEEWGFFRSFLRDLIIFFR